MKLSFRSITHSLIITASIITLHAVAQKDSLAPSKTPPGGLTAVQAPMFVSLGFDDNYFSGITGSGGTGGMTWITDYMRNLNNPAGTGKTETYDGTPARTTFFNTVEAAKFSGSESATYVKRAWRTAFEDGHELGNHTYSHPDGKAFTEQQWSKEILRHEAVVFQPYDANESTTAPDTTKGLGLTESDYYGFRTPFLSYSVNLFGALDSLGYAYDCSIEEGWEPDQDG